MDITGARWGLDGAEAVLKLRTPFSNGDFAEYWRYHLNRERFRVYDARYANGTILGLLFFGSGAPDVQIALWVFGGLALA